MHFPTRFATCLLAVAGAVSPAFAQASALNGPYFFLMTRPVDQSGHDPFVQFGVLNFDGAGNVSGTLSLAGPANGTLQSLSGSGTGSYSANSDGTVTLTLSGTLPVIGSFSGSTVLVTTDGGAGFYVVATDDRVHVVAGKGRSAAPSSGLSGTFAFESTRVPNGPNDQPGTNIGTVTFDGAGNATGVIYIANAGNAVQSGPFTGTYTPNADGSFTLMTSGGTTLIGAVTDGGAGIYLVQTGGSANLYTIEARKQ